MKKRRSRLKQGKRALSGLRISTICFRIRLRTHSAFSGEDIDIFLLQRVYYEGQLHKLGANTNSTMWRTRWCIVGDKSFDYFDSQGNFLDSFRVFRFSRDAHAVEFNTQKGAILYADVNDVVVSAENTANRLQGWKDYFMRKQAHQFEIHTGPRLRHTPGNTGTDEPRVYHFDAGSAEEVERWVQAIKSAMGRH
jgi:hypothetical protein